LALTTKTAAEQKITTVLSKNFIGQTLSLLLSGSLNMKLHYSTTTIWLLFFLSEKNCLMVGISIFMDQSKFLLRFPFMNIEFFIFFNKQQLQ